MNENEYEISTDKKRLDLAMIHDFLANESYWAKGIPLEVMKKSIEKAAFDKGYAVQSPTMPARRET